MNHQEVNEIKRLKCFFTSGGCCREVMCVCVKFECDHQGLELERMARLESSKFNVQGC